MDPAVQALVNIEHILELVLSNLSVVELIPKSRVCRCWKRIVDKILRKRSRSYAFDYEVLTCGQIEYGFRGEERLGYRTVGNKRARLRENEDSMVINLEKAFLKWRRQWNQPPKIIILFCKSVKTLGKDVLKVSTEIFDVFQKYAPNDCAIVMLRGPLCCRSSELGFTLKTEALSFLSSFGNRVNVLTWTSLRTERAKKRLMDAIKDFSLCQSDIKALLFFYDVSKGSVDHWMNTFVKFLKEELNLGKDVVILGCAIHDNAGFLHSRNCTNKMVSLMGAQLQCDKIERIHKADGGRFLAIAINGSSISSASLLVHSDVNTISEVENQVKMLKRSLPSVKKHNAFGIIVSCIDRMHDEFWYRDYFVSEDNVEIIALRKEFPSLPLLVMHSFGEIGNNFNLIDKKSSNELLHTGAAIFSVVHFDDSKSSSSHA